jgi:hypothetical protein
VAFVLTKVLGPDTTPVAGTQADGPGPRPGAARAVLGRFGLAVVEGLSMVPTMRPGDRLLVRYGSVPRPGALVLVRLPAGPGAEPVLAVKRALRRDRDGWFVERDNPREGVDSWAVGPVADHDVVAVVLARVWPRTTTARRGLRGAVRD